MSVAPVVVVDSAVVLVALAVVVVVACVVVVARVVVVFATVVAVVVDGAGVVAVVDCADEPSPLHAATTRENAMTATERCLTSGESSRASSSGHG